MEPSVIGQKNICWWTVYHIFVPENWSTPQTLYICYRNLRQLDNAIDWWNVHVFLVKCARLYGFTVCRTALWAFCWPVLILIIKACQVLMAILGQINISSYVYSDQMGKF